MHGKSLARCLACTCSRSAAIAFSPFQCHCPHPGARSSRSKVFRTAIASHPPVRAHAVSGPCCPPAAPAGWTHLPALQGSASRPALLLRIPLDRMLFPLGVPAGLVPRGAGPPSPGSHLLFAPALSGPYPLSLCALSSTGAPVSPRLGSPTALSAWTRPFTSPAPGGGRPHSSGPGN